MDTNDIIKYWITKVSPDVGGARLCKLVTLKDPGQKRG